jgi:cell division septum initiation protein DivIVA
MTHEQKQAMSHADEDIKPRVRPPSVQAAYLLERVRKMESEEAGVVEAAREKAGQWLRDAEVQASARVEKARLAYRARIASTVAKAPADVQELYFALARAGKGEE